MELTAQQVGEWLIYDPSTGNFRWRKRGARSPVRPGRIAGSDKPDGYRHIHVLGKRHYSHRLAWLLMTGEWPRKMVDHIDGNKRNNKWENLRHATRSQNAANGKMRANNTTGYKGVSFVKSEQKFRAHAYVNGKRRHLGDFATAAEAGAAYMEAATKEYGEFATDGSGRT